MRDRGMRPEDVHDLVAVSDPRVSPDGQTVAFVVQTIDREASEYRSAVWVVPTDGSTSARPFTHGPKRDSAPRWSPDGTRLCFVSDRGDDKTKAQLYVIPADGGEALKLTDLKESVESPVWSPDGTHIAFLARVRDEAYEEEEDRKRKPRRFTRLRFKLDNVGWTADRPKRLFVVPADGSAEPRRLLDDDHEEGVPTWSPDGTRIAFASARHTDWDTDTASDIYVIDFDGGEPERLTATDGSCSAPSWSPDGSKIAYLYSPGVLDSPRHTQVAAVDLSTRERRVLTSSIDRNCSIFMVSREPIWNGDRLLFALEDSGDNALVMVTADGGSEPMGVRSGEFQIKGYDLAGGPRRSDGGGAMGVHVQTTPTALTELYCGQTCVTGFGKGFAERRDLVESERFTAKSADGSQVQAWIMRPAGFEEGKTYPVLLNIHGGPFTQYGNGFFDEFQVYAGAGYVVVYSNPRGSSGYSEGWGRAINGPERGGSGWGTVDFEDLMAVTDAALERFGFCDPDRVGVMGGSYGGWMTTWIVAHTDRFKAACSERAVNSWNSMHGSSDIGWTFKGQFGTFAFEDQEGWAKVSPLTYATDITTPLLILHSENDLRCPIEQAEQLFTVLRLRKQDVELVRFPAEGHELSRSGSPAHRVQRFEIILDWFDRKLKG